MTNKEKAFKLNQEGIQLKRQGEFDLAIQKYNEAKQYDPINKNCYLNSYKLLMAFEKSIATYNILVYKHLDFLQTTPEIYQNSQSNEWHQFYLWNGTISDKFNVPNNIVFETIEKQPLLSLIAYDINSCFNAGFGVLLSDNTLADYHNIEKNLITNYKSLLLGQPPNGQDLRSSKYENVINIIGFLFLMNNLKLGNQMDPSEVPDLYKSSI